MAFPVVQPSSGSGMKLVRTRPCDGACCKHSPRWPNEDGSDCIFHDEQGCQIMRGEAEIPEKCDVLPHMTGSDAFIFSCLQWPHNAEARLGKTGKCCWQWQ